MKAILSTRVGGPETLKLEELPDPKPGAGEVLLAVKACGVNYPDLLIIEDRYQFKPPRPFAPGHEVAGDITEVGEGVTAYKAGDRVIAAIGHGGTGPAVGTGDLRRPILERAHEAEALPRPADRIGSEVDQAKLSELGLDRAALLLDVGPRDA